VISLLCLDSVVDFFTVNRNGVGGFYADANLIAFDS
jgi:hypothetical protein